MSLVRNTEVSEGNSMQKAADVAWSYISTLLTVLSPTRPPGMSTRPKPMLLDKSVKWFSLPTLG